MKIIANKLGKRFNREWVFRNFNYEFTPGKTYAITGPNGSGKSTLMQVLWGQMHPTTGTLSYEGVDLIQVYQSVAIATPYMDLIDEFTLEEMVHFHFKFKKSRLPLDQVINKIELETAKQKTLSTFSSGMRQRLKLALAFYTEANLIFLDEPCTNLDARSKQWYQQHLAQLPATSTVFIASNQPEEYPETAQTIDIRSFK